MDNPQILEKLGFELAGIEALDWIVMIAGVILLFYLCDLLCHKLIIPIVRKFTAKTVNRWDDMLLDKANINALCCRLRCHFYLRKRVLFIFYVLNYVTSILQ